MSSKLTLLSIFKKTLSLIVFLLSIHIKIFGQEAAFSQFYAAPLFLNPSMAAADDHLAVGFNYRTNYNKNLAPYKLGQFSIILPVRINSSLSNDKYFRNGYVGGVGISLYSESMGDLGQFNVSGASLATAYFLQVNHKHHITLGVQMGFIKRSIAFNKLTWGSQYDPDIGFNSNIIPSLELDEEKIWYNSIHFGATWFYNMNSFGSSENSKFRMFNGFAFSNLNKPEYSFVQGQNTRLEMLLKIHGGLAFKLADNIEIIPNYLIMRQNGLNHINIGTYVAYYISGSVSSKSNFYQLQLGSWYRFGDSYIVSLACEMRNLIVGISYDLNLSSYKFENKGTRTVEISIRFRNGNAGQQPRRNISHPII